MTTPHPADAAESLRYLASLIESHALTPPCRLGFTGSDNGTVEVQVIADSLPEWLAALDLPEPTWAPGHAEPAEPPHYLHVDVTLDPPHYIARLVSVRHVAAEDVPA